MAYHRWLWLLLLVALLLRLGYAASEPVEAVLAADNGGDSGWYMAVGWGFFSGQEHGWVRGIPYYNGTLPTPPLYIILVGLVQQFLPAPESVLLIRLLQCLASVATSYLCYRITALFAGTAAGLLAAALSSFHPSFVLEPANIATESFFIFFLACGFWLYLEGLPRGQGWQMPGALPRHWALVLCACAFALATLTRAVAVLFPLLILAHQIWLARRTRNPVRREHWRRNALLFLLAYSAVIGTWTAHNWLLWGRIVVVSDRLLPAIWRAVESEDGSPQENDALLLAGAEPDIAPGCEVDCRYQHPSELFLQRIAERLSADVGAVLRLRSSELAYALLQPHGTTQLGDVSVRAATQKWLREQGGLPGLLDILRIEGFVPKLVTWAFHLFAIGGGILGIALTRAHWGLTSVLCSYLVYTIAAHIVLLALPRYMFPLEMIWCIFAAAAVVQLQDRYRSADTVGVRP